MLVMKNFKNQCLLSNAEFQLDNITTPFENLNILYSPSFLCATVAHVYLPNAIKIKKRIYKLEFNTYQKSLPQ